MRPALALLGAVLLPACTCGARSPSDPGSEPGPAVEPPDPGERPTHPDAPFDEATSAGMLLLEEGDVLAAAVRGPFGPEDGCVLAVLGRGKERHFHATLACGERHWRSGPLGEPGWGGAGVAAVRMVDVDGDGYVEAAVVASWSTGTSPLPLLATAVLRWNGAGLERVRTLEDRLLSQQTVDGVDRVLARKQRGRR